MKIITKLLVLLLVAVSVQVYGQCTTSTVHTIRTTDSDGNITLTCTGSSILWMYNGSVVTGNTTLVSLSIDNTTLLITGAKDGTIVSCNSMSYCLRVPSSTSGSGNVYIIGGAAGGGALLVIIIIIIIIVVCCCCCLLMRRKDDSPSSPLIRQMSISRHEKRSIRKSTIKLNDPVDEYRRHTHTEAMALHPVILIDHFSSHLAVMRMNDNQRFMEEFGTIPMVPDLPKDASETEVNKPKNRYDNILPYDHSRVKLSTIKWQEGSDYINANFLDGFMKTHQYIATQGPLASTIGEFWRMIWEQNSRTIVMVTKLQEKATIKCDQYWPNEINVTCSYGGIDVTLVEVVPLANYTFRTFSIIKGGASKDIREVKQFHFTAWPDHGVPDFPTSMLAMTRCVRAHHDQCTGTGPMIVHCSAGVGRTGTFIVIDSMIQRILHNEKTVDIYGHVSLLRNQRNCMVQTEDQYFFIHEAMNEAIACGVTEVTAEEFPVHLDKLELIQEDGESSLLELEFQRLATDRTEPHRFASATRNINKGKNRFVNIMPYEYNRVKLSFIRATDGSDYINASYIDSYRQQKAFLATQGPLRNTVGDFWRMIWEHKSPIIVMLTQLEERQQECSHLYWSDRNERLLMSDVTVEITSKREVGGYIERLFTLSHKEQPDKTHTVRHFQFLGWPERGVPTSALPLLQLIQNVQETYTTLRTSQPITVMCSSGVGRTGVFITLHIILERFAVEGLLDLFQTVKMLRIQRSAMVQTREQYHFCYDAVLDYLLNTGQLPQVRSLSMDRRASVYRAPSASSPNKSGDITQSTIELGSAFSGSTGGGDNGSIDNRTSMV